MADYNEDGSPVTDTPAGYVDIPESESSHETVIVTGTNWTGLVGWLLVGVLVWVAGSMPDSDYPQRRYTP